MGISPVCGCWDELVSMTICADVLENEIGARNWKGARETLEDLGGRVERFEGCAGLRLVGVRNRMFTIEREMARYEWAGAVADAGAMKNELVWDVAGCRVT